MTLNNQPLTRVHNPVMFNLRGKLKMGKTKIIMIICLLVVISGCSGFDALERKEIFSKECEKLNQTYYDESFVPFNDFRCLDASNEIHTYKRYWNWDCYECFSHFTSNEGA